MAGATVRPYAMQSGGRIVDYRIIEAAVCRIVEAVEELAEIVNGERPQGEPSPAEREEGPWN